MCIRDIKYGIDIFCGAGGLSLGAENAGIKMAYAIELNEHAANTYKRNNPRTKVICEDIRKINASDLQLDEGKDLFVIMGGPPCQGFSLSNTRTRTMDNPNNMLFEEFVRLVKELNPQWFIFENVYGLATIDHGQVKKMIASRFEDLGYIVKYDVLLASDYGVPQNRNRFFMVGNRMGIEYKFPPKMETHYTVKDAIDDLPELKNGDSYEKLSYKFPKDKVSEYAKKMRENSKYSIQNYVSKNNDLVIERYKHIGQGENWSAIPDSLMENYSDKKRCHSGIYRRLIADEPSVVISNYRKSMLIHPFQHRGLSVREAARIQSFPDDFIFEGPLSYIQQQIGNAVPPLLSEAVVKQILKYSED